MSVTIYDIARKAKVGVGTVSRVLNNHPSVSPKTREHVLSIARKLEYQPNASAQRLARRKSRTATVIMPYITNNFFIEMLRGIQDTLFKHDYDLLLYGVNHPRQIESYLQRSMRTGHSDGILIASLTIPDSYTQQCLRDNFPLIMIDRRNQHFDSFSVENSDGARKATEYLLSLGHTRLAMISGASDAAPSREREEGYLKALAGRPDGRNIGIFPPQNKHANDGYSKEGGYEAMNGILSRPPAERPTAVFVASDIQALGALQSLGEHGLVCPRDISIVSFDDIELAAYYGLTTMRQPIYTMGVLATERLFARLDAPDLDPVQQTFTPELVVRRTAEHPHGTA